MRGVEAVIHARGDADGQVQTVAVVLTQRVVVQQIAKAIGEAFGLDQLSICNLSECPDDAIAGAAQ